MPDDERENEEIRVVLDTNILVSAALKPHGYCGRLVFTALPLVSYVVSPPILKEYREVLMRPKFKLTPVEALLPIYLVVIRSRLVEPVIHLTECKDPDDNMFLECAETGQADFLITGNLKHFPAKWKNTRVITPARFVRSLDRFFE